MKKTKGFFVGVPFTGCRKVVGQRALVTTREDEAIGIAAGAYLAGEKATVYMQNSGLGNCVDIITSLLKPYGIPVKIIIAERSKPEHHAFMGKITRKLVELLEYDQVEYHQEFD